MANQPETSVFDASVYQIAVGDPVGGGPSAVINQALLALTNRTRWLYDQNTDRAAEILAIQSGGFQGYTNCPISGLSLSQSGTLPNLTVTAAAGLVATMTDGYDGTTGLERRITLKTATNLSCVCSNTGAVVLQINQSGVPELVFVQDVIISAKAPTKVTPYLWHDYINNEMIMNTGGFSGARYACVIAYIEAGDVVIPAPYRQSLYDPNTPAGTVVAMAGSRAPSGGWLALEGRTVAPDEHPRLWYYLWDFGGTPAPATLPDLRGEFIRGWDNARGIDPSRTLLSFQADEFKAHQHPISTEYNSGTGGTPKLAWGDDAGVDTTLNSGSVGGAETRPRNIAMRYWVKF